ncbi:MAG TPA: glycosyl hydrolase family 5 [Bacteroides sp.]|jgi:endoglucanase|nr:glycosyl hydrolase family 5 [Bacteroides sp.]
MKNIVLLAGLTALMMSSCEVKEKVSSSNGEPFGMNIACADFGSVFPGEYNKDYTYPTDSDLVYWEKKGLKLVRMPFKWERLQYKLDGGLNKHDLEKMKEFVVAAQKRGIKVLLDLHNYCRRFENGDHRIIGTYGITNQNYAGFWKKIASEFKDYDNIYGYGLMNEPHDLPDSISWFKMAQLAIDSIRMVDTKNTIVVGGNSWSSAKRWLTESDTLKFLKDPAENLMFEAHCYFDKDGSGTYKYSYEEEEGTPEKGRQLVAPFVEWLSQNNLKGIVGEYGIPDDDPRWEVTLDNFLSYLSKNGVNATYWASGPWWGEGAQMVIPTYKGGKEYPQVKVLEKYIMTEK